MHLDLKPNNIMINWYKTTSVEKDTYKLVKLDNPRVTLIDFSVSTKAPRDADLDDYPCRGNYGTRRYRAPEMIFNGTWNRSIDTFALALIVLECVNATRLLENKYRDQNGRRFPRRKDRKGRKVHEQREIVDYIVRMAKTFLGKPSLQYLHSLEEEFQPFVKDATNLPDAEQKESNSNSNSNIDDNDNEIQENLPLSPKSFGQRIANENIGNPCFTPVHSYMFDHGPTLSDVHQSQMHVSSKEQLIVSFLNAYKPFIQHQLVSNSDLSRLQRLQHALHQVLVWDPSQRATPELLLLQHFQHERDSLLSYLFSAQELTQLQVDGFNDLHIHTVAKTQIQTLNATCYL
ncbi:hypothetical protein RFI_14445 [Reticulomyxa filosa]|uniref:Protein kinase domain-containing protein n=1 Tax=Reticulomyxa filosa TaxID=46433 RepID=X6NA16_RETFI|nr:hypothetical protein RFI_14445 [Reticulomyxa filosa]|eukprot:ETO22748.1 hypothetical protein RFI_14445 [Reticulomyxa filosa]